MKAILVLLLAVIYQVLAADIFTYEPNFTAGVRKAEAEGKPIIILILKSTCSACKKLKASLEANKQQVLPLAQKFVIVQTTDNSDPTIRTYCLNPGQTSVYYPRTCFYTPQKVNLGITSPNGEKWSNFYSNAEQFIQAMKLALAKFNSN